MGRVAAGLPILLLLLAAASGASGKLEAQERLPASSHGWTGEAPAPAPGRPDGTLPPLRPSFDGQEPPGLSPGRAFLLSAVLPGAAQFALDQWRWPLYLAAEGAGWYGYLHYRDDARDLRSAYRNLAWEVPRQGFAEERRDSDFEYYERMAKWPASGPFDADGSAPGLQPEEDPTTFNGSVWSLARDLYSVDDGAGPGSEAYERALDHYRDRAVPEALRWDWAGRTDEQALFGRLIRDSDHHFQRATTLVGLLLGNHVLSAVDGYLSARLRRRGLPGAQVRIFPAEGAAATAWILRVELTRR